MHEIYAGVSQGHWQERKENDAKCKNENNTLRPF